MLLPIPLITKQMEVEPIDQLLRGPKTVTVIISTNNKPAGLQKVIWGLSPKPIKILNLLLRMTDQDNRLKNWLNTSKESQILPLSVRGIMDFKTAILNKAILSANAEYLIFSDGDCIPYKDCVGDPLARQTAIEGIGTSHHTLHAILIAKIKSSPL